MASLISFHVAVVLLFCFAPACLSYTFVDENPIRLKSQGQHYDDDHQGFFDDHSSSLANIITRPPIEAIYQFGDSIADTGNIALYSVCGKFPYGISYIKPTGRCCDGLLIIDHIASFAGFPFLDAYLNKEGDFGHGVNFAVTAATALDVKYLREKYNLPAGTQFSLTVQLAWFKSYLKTTFPDASENRGMLSALSGFKDLTLSYNDQHYGSAHEIIMRSPYLSDCPAKLSKALIMMGEIGGNDYHLAFGHGKTLAEIYTMVPDVVQQIMNATEEVINLGATRIAIPGNFPVGCMTTNLARFQTDDTTQYDELKCLKYLNDFAQFHNDQLQLAIIGLQIRYPNVAIVYLDYFGSMGDVLQNADSLGFDTEVMYKACCGQGNNEYNFGRFCGNDGVPYCEDPQKRVSWDGIHLTQKTYYLMAKRLLGNALHGASNVL